jgi:hypothetical protein
MRDTACFLGSAKNRSAAILAALILIAGGFPLLSVACRWTKPTERLNFESGDFSSLTKKFAASL